MSHKKTVFILIAGILICLGNQAGAQTAFPSADRTIDWSQAGIPGGIPVRTVCQSLGLAGQLPTYAQNVTAAQINSALSTCSSQHPNPAGSAVQLQPGTYTVTGTISIPSYVTLFGAGAAQTIIKNTAGSNPLIHLGASYSFGGAQSVGTLAKGATSMSVANPAGFVQGTYLEFDQVNDNVLVSIAGGYGACTWCDGADGSRTMGQIVEVTSASGNPVSFKPALNWNYSTSLSSRARIINNMGIYAGVEDLQIQNINPNTGSNQTYNIYIGGTAYSWLKGVESFNSPNAHVQLADSYRTEIRDSYFHGQPQYIPNRDGPIALVFKTSGALIENNMFSRMLHTAIMEEWGVTANVIAYNYSDGSRSDDAPTWQLGDVYNHGAHPMFNLYEGNNFLNPFFDSGWGSSSHDVLFRNNVRGFQAGYTQDIASVRLQALNTNYSVVGNVLGSANNTAGYIAVYPNNPEKFIINIGNMDGSHAPGSANPASTILLGGNYDYFNHAVIWQSNAPSYSTRHLTQQTLPNSLYRSSQPGWFKTPWKDLQNAAIVVPWPAIGPDVSGGNGDTSGHANKIPAQLCFENTIGKNIPFNATQCYPTSAIKLGPPVHLRLGP